MRARHITGFLLFLAGMTLAVCTLDGSEHEIMIRFAGVAMVAIGALVGGMFEKFTKDTDTNTNH